MFHYIFLVISTRHQMIISDSRSIAQLSDKSMALVVTSPPYPMIEMWDSQFGEMNTDIKNALENNEPDNAFELMHRELDKVWKECYRVLIDGGIACINIGDAVRTAGGMFRLFNNHSRIIHSCMNMGFITLPLILWRKSTNAPNKFMGSGMLPGGAYITLEHEYILILRKGRKREYKTPEEKQNRRSSAYFWEERNTWFSDIWDFSGIRQEMRTNGEFRNRSGAFPLELPYRLINMFSVKGDTVLDPFLGTGTTMLAAMIAGRNSAGIEKEKNLTRIVGERITGLPELSEDRIERRLRNHQNFISGYLSENKKGYRNERLGVQVVTRQEIELELEKILSVGEEPAGTYKVNYFI